MHKKHGLLALALAAIVAGAGIYGLMVQRDQATAMAQTILANDNANQDVGAQVAELKTFATTHMKVNVAFELTGSYNRAVEAANQAAKTTGNAAAYEAAQKACDKKGVDSIRQAQCVANALNASGQAVQAAKPVQLPDQNQYKYHFVGPAWNLDLPGALLLASAALAAIGLVIVAVAPPKPAAQ